MQPPMEIPATLAACGAPGNLLRQDLDRHRATEPRVDGAIHLTHPTVSKRFLNLVRAQPKLFRERHARIRRC